MSEGKAVPPGAAVLVLVAKPAPAQAIARVRESEPSRLVLQPPEDVPAAPGSEVGLVVGPRTERYVARAVLREASPDHWLVELRSRWQRFDARRNARFPASGGVRFVFDDVHREGELLNVSGGGCAFRVPAGAEPPPGAGLVLELTSGEFSSHVPGRVVGLSPLGDGEVRVHVRFGELRPHQQAFVRSVVTRSAALAARKDFPGARRSA